MAIPGRRLGNLCAGTLLAVLVAATGAGAAAESRQVLGYGVQGCNAFVAALDGWGSSTAGAIVEYQRYREWLAGLVTGLTLATGVDVLQGVEVDGAMRRIGLLCEEKPQRDVFSASMALIRELSAGVQ